MQLLFNQAQSCKSLRIIIKIGNPVTDEEKQRSKETGIIIHTMDEVLVCLATQWEGEELLSYLSDKNGGCLCVWHEMWHDSGMLPSQTSLLETQ